MVKPGGSYWVGPFTDAQDDHEGYWLLKGGDRDEHPIPLGVPAIVVHESDVIPHSPVLPKVAAWLAEHPDDLEHLWKALVEAIRNMSDTDHVRVAYSFAYAIERSTAALTPEAGDGART